MQRWTFALAFCAAVAAAPAPAHAQFTPFSRDGASTESHTGLWFGTWMTGNTPKLPIETITRATKEAVTGGVALKVIARPGSIGRITYEHDLGGSFSPSILTFYAKASAPVGLRVFRQGTNGSTVVQLTTQWKKFDIPTTSVDWLLTFELDQAASQETYYILDRIGRESTASAQDLSQATTGPDQDISTSQLILGAQNIAAIAQKLKNKQPFKIVAMGDSVVAGSQIDLGNGYGWNAATKNAYLFPSVLGQMLEAEYGYSGIAVHNFGAVFTVAEAISNNEVQNKVLSQAGAGDLVILELGGNDLVDGTSVAQWKTMMKTVIGQVKAGGVTNIIFAGLTLEGPILSDAAAISKAIGELVTEEGIAAIDLSTYAIFRGANYSWADSANPSHPDASGHMFIAKMLATAFTGKHFNVVDLKPAGSPPADAGPDSAPTD
ncbi:MAG: SGNH/GDSL hydrolase family protein, partial [Myxococcales bacterium]|nr:SGNH/GDSL hydrolase family protein [Myxococcales bacterium]